tara:strand:- start:72 stop:677 length:606 start_codon:yes stop_codon:yes gene_type:complete
MRQQLVKLWSTWEPCKLHRKVIAAGSMEATALAEAQRECERLVSQYCHHELRGDEAVLAAKQAEEILLETHRLRCNQPEAGDVREMFRRLDTEDISSGKAVEIVLDMIAGAKAAAERAAASLLKDKTILNALIYVLRRDMGTSRSEGREEAFAKCEAKIIAMADAESAANGQYMNKAWMAFICAANAVAAAAIEAGAKGDG